MPSRRLHDHHINLKEESGPINVKPYRYPHYQKNEIEKWVRDLLTTGVIRPSTGPYSSPVLLVKKHDCWWRLCIDYWALNDITIKDKFPILVIDELLDKLYGAKFLTKLDLRSSYYQIRMNDRYVEKTAFRTHKVTMNFLSCHLAIPMLPLHFNRLWIRYLKTISENLFVFFDDILFIVRHGKSI